MLNQQPHRQTIDFDDMTEYVEHITSKMFQPNATKYFESKNISISDLNITSDNLNDFLEKLRLFEHADSCTYNCNGFFRDMLVSYKSMHGYVSLVVSVIFFQLHNSLYCLQCI